MLWTSGIVVLEVLGCTNDVYTVVEFPNCIHILSFGRILTLKEEPMIFGNIRLQTIRDG
jgi:hypothetical protein